MADGSVRADAAEDSFAVRYSPPTSAGGLPSRQRGHPVSVSLRSVHHLPSSFATAMNGGGTAGNGPAHAHQPIATGTVIVEGQRGLHTSHARWRGGGMVYPAEPSPQP